LLRAGVSNHGGRQLDAGVGSLAVLPEVVEAVGGRCTVIVDGGFLRGTDIIKAIALGVRRPQQPKPSAALFGSEQADESRRKQPSSKTLKLTKTAER